jgi:hypothetical protein
VSAVRLAAALISPSPVVAWQRVPAAVQWMVGCRVERPGRVMLMAVSGPMLGVMVVVVGRL